MEASPKPYTFRGMDGYAGFRNGQVYELTPDEWDDGSGTVTVEMPHAPTAGWVKFSATQWREWFEKNFR